MKIKRYTKEWMVWLGIVGLMVGCTRRGESTDKHRARAFAPAQVTESSPVVGDKALPEQSRTQVGKDATPVELMADATSPYTAGLFVDSDAIYLLTDSMAYRLVPGASPQKIPIENGGVATVTRTDLVYWSKGAIWRVPKTGGKTQRLVSLKHRPQFLMAAGDDLAWLDMPVLEQFQIQALVDHKVRTLFYHPGRIEVAALDAGRVFFVRKDDATTWRIGSVSVRGGEVSYATPKTGPVPAKLGVADDVFYYDLNSGEIRRLSADLSREEVLKTGLICSPIAVGATIYCPNMEGLYALARHPGATPKMVFPEPRRITTVAANSTFLAWLADAGPDHLRVMMMRPVLDEGK